MKNLIGIFLLLFGSLTISAQSHDIDRLLSNYNHRSIPYISVEELQMKRFHDSIYILDAREREEYQVSHLPNAKFVGYSDFSIDRFSQKFKNKAAPIVVYCSVGIRSENIAEKLKKAGYTSVYNLYGGIFEWKNTGFLLFSNGKETNRVHTFSKTWAKYLEEGKKIY